MELSVPAMRFGVKFIPSARYNVTDTFQTIDPASGEEIQSYSHSSNDDVNAKIEGCLEAFLSWRKKNHEERGEILKVIGAKLRDRREELAQLMTHEMGKLSTQSCQEVDLCAAICDYTAEHGPREFAIEDREISNGKRGRVAHAPLRVIYGIQPWNFPGYQTVRYSIANLMAGSGVLLKHAANVTGSGLLLEEIYREAGLPEGLFTTLVISRDQSDDVIAHKLVRGVTLTGRPGAGNHVGERAGKALKKTVLELGTNDA